MGHVPTRRAQESVISEVVSLHGWAHGGEAVGRLADGRAVFVGYAIPGETVRITVTESRKAWARARLEEVVTPSPDRVAPPCPYFGQDRCGGCRLQHIGPDRQAALVRQVVVETLERVGRIPDPPVATTISAGSYGYRTRARFAVDADGRLGFRRAGSHDVIAIDRCLLLDGPTQAARDIAGEGFGAGADVEVRSDADGAPSVIAIDGRRSDVVAGGDAGVERVGGFELRVSAASFFQTNRHGAELLLDLVREAADVRPGDAALDLYAGVGLFARGLAADGAAVTAVESHPAAAADAAANLAGLADAVRSPAEAAVAALREEGRTVDVVVLDPPRAGAGTAVVAGIAQLATRTIVYVACDPAALARDARTLVEAGWRLTRATPVDQFAQTAAVEVVAVFAKA